MNCKVNIKIINEFNKNLKVVLLEIDPIKNDVLGEKIIQKTQDVEFIFPLAETGEFNPELQIKVLDSENEVISETVVNSEISGWSRDKITGMFEKTTIEFIPIEIR